MSRAPMPKKVVEKKSFSKKQSLYSQLLCAYKELPSEIADLDDFVAELERNSCILFFRGALKRGNPARFHPHRSASCCGQTDNERDYRL